MGSRQTQTESPDVLRALEVLRSAGFVFVAPKALRLVSVAEAAAMLSVSGSTIRQWQRLGRLPGAAMLPGGDLRIPVGDLEAIVAAGRLSRHAQAEVAA